MVILILNNFEIINSQSPSALHYQAVVFVCCDIDTVSQKPDLDYIKFSWNKMTACEFQEHWKTKHMSEQADFIHMIQVDGALY